MRRETDLKFDENGKAILGVTKIVIEKKEEPFRVSNAISTQRVKKVKITRSSAGVKLE
jgi:hypothetical protein